MNGKDYAEITKKLGLKYRIGKYAIQFLPRDPGGRVCRLFSIVPLDEWITDPKEVERIMRERGLEL